MSYVIITPVEEPVITNWYNPDEHKFGTIVINLSSKTYTKDGKNWREIKPKS
jgi:hypothetical protein